MKTSVYRAALLFLTAFLMLPGVEPALAQGRQHTRIDAEWRYSAGDHPGAEAPAYRDDGWQHIGLPHSFGIPYFASPHFYVGYGWYRKHITLPALKPDQTVAIEFEAAFQDAEVFVNGVPVGHHLGGYTGFQYEITHALVAGDNVIAVRLKNLWNAQLNPRGGEHNFNGGIYRDVYLVTTADLHVDWYGTFVTTPGLSAAGGPVHIETEIRNDSKQPRHFELRTDILDAGGKLVTSASTESIADPGTVDTIEQSTPFVSNPKLWSPAQPNMYTAVTHVLEQGREIDTYRTPFGFRWIKWTAEQGFFLNGEHLYFRGADAHQDHAGWGDAVADAGITRDVRMIKDAGMNFIRGSHYPHSPVFSDACDRLGVMLWSENSFWGTGGAKAEGSWTASAYPPNEADQKPFEENVKRSLAEMIRIHRNHPSIIAWSMGNEVFFSDANLMPKVRIFLGDLVAETHQLDPTRPAAIGGVQRGNIDKIGDVAGYNGDGAKLFIDPGVPNAVTEYGSTISLRPGSYMGGFGDMAGQPAFAWRSGQAIWAAFDHGSIFSTMGQMGMIDYFRLPKRQWYWYRNAYLNLPPPDWPERGAAASLEIHADHDGPLRADGSDDVQLVVTVHDGAGKRIANTPPVDLTIVSGPGELPTGRTIHFAEDSDIAIRDGEAAIEMRSYQSGTILVRATSPGLQSATLTVEATGGPVFVPGETPVAADRTYMIPAAEMKTGVTTDLSLNRPTDASSAVDDEHSSGKAADGDADSFWQPRAGNASSWWQVDFEGRCRAQKVHIVFGDSAVYHYRVEEEDGHGGWKTLLDHTADKGPVSTVTYSLPESSETRVLRLAFTADSALPKVREVQVKGAPLQ